MGSIISMALSAVIGCGLCVAAAAGVTQVATTHIPVEVQQPLVDYGTRSGPSNPASNPTPTQPTEERPAAKPSTQPATKPSKTSAPVSGKPTPNTPNNPPGSKK